MDAALVSVLAYGGLRPREALALRWSDLSDTQFVVRGNSGRFGLPVQDRSVSMLRALDRDLEVLRTDRQVDRDGYVFGDDACHVHNDWLRDWRRDAYGSAAARCFPRPCAPGMLRFVLATLLLREGKSIAAVADQLGESADFLAELYERDDLPCTDQKPGLADAEIATAREAAAPALWSSAMVERFADDGKVIAGKDGWLFLAYDGNRVLDQHLGRLRLSDVQLERWTSALEMRVSWLRPTRTRSTLSSYPTACR
jgi:hypothetical protein